MKLVNHEPKYKTKHQATTTTVLPAGTLKALEPSTANHFLGFQQQQQLFLAFSR
jgi:hypothetical protein